MIIQGTHNSAKAFASIIEEEAITQIKELCNQSFCANSSIRIMPDVHAGKGCTVGFTMSVSDYVCPNLIGVDIGCGMLTINIGNQNVNLEQLDKLIREKIPFGKNVHEGRMVRFDKIQELKCFRELKDTKRLERSIGSLGGGNHFIEIDKGNNGNLYLIIHSGSRNLGHQVASYYQNLAIELCSGKDKMYLEIQNMIDEYKSSGRKQDISKQIGAIKRKYNDLLPPLPNDLCYLKDQWKENYLHDMKICQEYAVLNRSTMAKIILEGLELCAVNEFETIHNYINFEDNILRKGAISAQQGKQVLIPINMIDGCILGVGKGNADWNYSAPHGAGRLMSRTKAKEVLNMDDFENTMKDIYTTSVSKETLDEAPMAYKPIESILENINDTVEVVDIIKPIYNFKASE